MTKAIKNIENILGAQNTNVNTNTNNIANNVSDISTNTSGVANNVGDITTLEGRVDTLEAASNPSAEPAILTIESHTADDNLTNAETGSVHTNLGAGGTITLNLPDPGDQGVNFTFAVQTTQQFRIDPGSTTIRDDSGQTIDKYKWADAVGECLRLVADENGDWITIAKRGTWSEQA